MENLEELIAENQGSLFAFLYRLCGDADVAEEVMQETFVRAIGAAKRYRPEARVSTWLFSIAANLVRDRWRRQVRRGDALPLDDLPLPAPETTDEQALGRVDGQALRATLLRLPLEQRTAIILRYYHDLSYEEIARTMVCPVGTVRSRIHNGVERLRSMLALEVTLR